MSPIIKLRIDSRNAGQNPILRVCPKQPTPKANNTAITSKNNLSASILVMIKKVNNLTEE